MSHRAMTFDDERFSVNTAFIKKSGEHFEVVVDPDVAVAFKESGKGDVREIVKSGHVYTNVKKGDLASEMLMREVFGTSEPFAVAERIIREGEVQLTKEHRDRIRENKRKRIIALIARNAIDPRTKLPHPQQRIELALEEAKVKIEEFKTADDQITDVVRKLQPILPIRFENALIEIHIPVQYAPKLYGNVQGFGTIKKQQWLSDGSWQGELEVPAGLVPDIIDQLNAKTHGSVQVTPIGRGH
jgi:ribosome maturation protein SDO1